MRKFLVVVVATLTVSAIGGCGGTVSVPLDSIAFDASGGYVLVPRENRSAKKTAAGANAYFCEKGTCRSIPVGDLTKSDEGKKKKKRKKDTASFPLEPKYLGPKGGYVLIPRESQKTRITIIGSAFAADSVDAGAAGADVYFCENFACNKVPVR